MTISCLSKTYIDEHAFAFEFFDKWAAELIPSTAGGGFVILHEGLDASDAVKFPSATYGSVSKGNLERYTAICNAYSGQGAQMDDLASASNGQVGQRDSQTGINDAGWNIVPSNYDRFITQIDPENTSIGLWRIGGEYNSSSHPYDRFARSFQNSTGKNTMSFDIHDDLLSNPGKAIKLSVIYYDDGNGQFELQYDAKGDNTKTAFAVTKENTKTWKTASAVVSDGLFGNNGPNGADLMLVNVDSEDDIFHMVEVLKLCDVTIGTSGRGTVEATHGLNSFDLSLDEHMEGYELDLTAVPEQGWELTSWSGEVSSTSEKVKIFPTPDTRATANFSYTGRFYSEDNFNSADLSGGQGWSGAWILDAGAQSFYSTGPNEVCLLNDNGQITRTLATPINNAELRFKYDVDKMDITNSDAVRAEVYNGSWHTVWEIIDNSENRLDQSSTPNGMFQKVIDVSAYGTISQIRFSCTIEDHEYFWLDNVRIAGYDATATNDKCYFTADPISAANGSDAAPYSGSIAGHGTDPNGVVDVCKGFRANLVDCRQRWHAFRNTGSIRSRFEYVHR